MKKLSIVLTIVLTIVLMFFAANLKAAPTQNIWITVSVSVGVDVTVLDSVTNIATPWLVLNKPFSFITNRDTAISVSNSGLATTTLSLGVISLGVFGSTGWTNRATQGLNEFVLNGLFGPDGSAQPAPATYIANDVITTAQQDATVDTIFGDASLSPGGVAVNPADKRDLWLLLLLPTSGIASPVTPTMQVIVSGATL